MPEENDKAALQNLVDASYQRCRMSGTFAADFYDRFLMHPEISPKFKGVDLTKQARLLDHGIRHLILFYHAPNYITSETMIALGQSHAIDRLCIEPYLYDIFLDVLLETVKENDPKYDDKLRAVWVEVLSHGISVMISMFNE